MEGYLGEETLKTVNTPYFSYTKTDWAMLYIELYGLIEGVHHKDWLLDQVSRILKGTKVIVKKAKWDNGTSEYRISLDKPSTEYLKWRKQFVEEGTDFYDEGIAP